MLVGLLISEIVVYKLSPALLFPNYAWILTENMA